MIYTFYYAKIPYYNSERYGDCPIKYLMKKYGYIEFLPIPKSKKNDDGTYLFCIPKIISFEFIHLMKIINCTTTYASSSEFIDIDFTNTVVDSCINWSGCCFESIYFVKTIDI